MIATLDPKHDTLDDVDVVVDDAKSGLGDLSTDEYDENIEAELRDAMGRLGKAGSLLSLHTLPESLGGVSVKGVGNIAMPLDEKQAQQISAHARDTAYIATLEATDFALDESIWTDTIQGFLNQASRNLGVTTQLRATPSTMILMKSGLRYGEHLLPPEPDSIGSLVVFLPSKHEGGEIAFKDGETETVVFAPNRAAQSFTTWHYKTESLPIQSGYLWLLTFSVNADTKLDTAKLELPRQDHILLQHVKSLSDELCFEIFLAVVKKERAIVLIPHANVISFFYGYNQYGRPHSEDGAWALFGIYARACLKIDAPPSSAIIFKEICNFMMAPTPDQMEGSWFRIPPIDIDLLDVLNALLKFGFYSWFSHYVQNAIDLPKSFLPRFCKWLSIAEYTEEEQLEAIEKALVDVIIAYPRPAQQLRALKTAIDQKQQTTFEGIPRPRSNGIPTRMLHFARRVLNTCVEACKDKQLVVQDGRALAEFALYFDDPFEFLHLVIDKIGLERQTAAILGLIHKVHHYGMYSYLLKLDCLKFTREVAKSLIVSTNFEQWRGITSGPYFDRFKNFAVDGMMSDNDYDYDNHDDSDQDILDEQDYMDLDNLDDRDNMDLDNLDDRDNINPDTLDGQKEWDDYEQYIEENDQQVIHDAYDGMEYRYADFCRTYRYHDEEDAGSIRRLDKTRYEHQYGKAKPLPFPRPGAEGTGVHFRTLYCFIDQLLSPEDQFDGVLELVVSKIVEAAPQIPYTEFETLWIPLVKEFIPSRRRFELILEEYREQLMARLLSAILKVYVDTWVGQCPERPGQARPGVRCSCSDCKGMNVFLADPLLRAGRFRGDRIRVKHVYDELLEANVDFKLALAADASAITMSVLKSQSLFTQALRQWGNRRHHATKQVAKWGLEGLEFMFGTEWMSFLSMGHLGGVGFDNLEIRTLLKLETGLNPTFVWAKTPDMFFRGLPRPPTAAGQASRPARKRKRSEADSSSDV
ncbi:uncharacterized protein Triagg1_8639 [Trichoderma aggressivum f. europaeum]|uniref:Uncharacterized protein n=1 Tax=Trichoderma aggressivum f. europaeum TaxID=173218 RepID=A0AAE1LZT0_9HYPO|nr:hypothetical protein Triagg1_8639 [Trichoderma aggressivum f. europaeum]